MSTETAWRIEQRTDDETYVDYVRRERVAEIMMGRDDTIVTAIGYVDTVSEWDKIMTLAEFGDDVSIDIDHEAAVDALNFEAIGDHYSDGTAAELERVGTSWDEATDAEQRAFALLTEKLQRMSRQAERALNQRVWSTPVQG